MVGYGYYNGVYGGQKIQDPVTFRRLEMKAKLLLNGETFGRIKDLKDEKVIEIVKFTICELVDAYVDAETVGHIGSKSLGDSSISYTSNSIQDINSKLSNIIESNLQDTGLLYAGFRRC